MEHTWERSTVTTVPTLNHLRKLKCAFDFRKRNCSFIFPPQRITPLSNFLCRFYLDLYSHSSRTILHTMLHFWHNILNACNITFFFASQIYVTFFKNYVNGFQQPVICRGGTCWKLDKTNFKAEKTRLVLPYKQLQDYHNKNEQKTKNGMKLELTHTIFRTN